MTKNCNGDVATKADITALKTDITAALKYGLIVRAFLMAAAVVAILSSLKFFG